MVATGKGAASISKYHNTLVAWINQICCTLYLLSFIYFLKQFSNLLLLAPYKSRTLSFFAVKLHILVVLLALVGDKETSNQIKSELAWKPLKLRWPFELWVVCNLCSWSLYVTAAVFVVVIFTASSKRHFNQIFFRIKSIDWLIGWVAWELISQQRLSKQLDVLESLAGSTRSRRAQWDKDRRTLTSRRTC